MRIIKEGYSRNIRTSLKKINEGWEKKMNEKIVDEVKDPVDPKIAGRVKYYRSLANLDESAEITEDNLDDWALTALSAEYNIDYNKAKNDILSFSKK